MEGQEGHGWSFPITRLAIQMRKAIGGVWWWIIVSASALWTLDLDLGLRPWA